MCLSFSKQITSFETAFKLSAFMQVRLVIVIVLATVIPLQCNVDVDDVELHEVFGKLDESIEITCKLPNSNYRTNNMGFKYKKIIDEEM